MHRQFVVAVLITLAAVVAVAQEAAESSDCPPRYAYCGWTGPQQWAHIPDSDCGGTKQSPVNLTNWQTVSTGPEIEVTYVDTTATVSNSGHDIRLRPPTTNNTIKIEGTTYPLDNIHFHTPSEHLMRGTPFPAELHVVHKLGEDYAVIAVLLPSQQEGSSVFSPIFAALPVNVCASRDISFEWNRLLPARIRNYYTYDGSLTTPPCTETATFYFANNTGLRLTGTQRGRLHSLGENARRPIQPINGRTITLVQPR